MMVCEFCKKEIVSDGEIISGKLYHHHCLVEIKELREKQYRESKGLFHKCPACNGKGYTEEKYSKYPGGYPDSGSVDWEKYPEYVGWRNVDCKVCDRKGYTSKKLKPITKIVGYEAE